MSNVIKFYPSNAAENPDAVLEQAIGEFESVLVIGYNNDGELDARASLNLSREKILWMMRSFEMQLLNCEY